MALEIVRVQVEPSFNPSSRKHLQAAIELASKEHGPGWDAESYDPGNLRLTLSRSSALTEFGDRSAEDTFEVSLGHDIRSTEGERTAQRLEADNPGFFLTEFRPHVKKARLSRMNEGEFRTRDAIAGVLGVPRWDVKVSDRKGGGYLFRLPPKYSPGKHFDSLQDVAEQVSGRPGWYVKINAKELSGEIIPSNEPTFDEIYPFDFDAFPPTGSVEGPALWKIPLGMALGANGQPNHLVCIDFDGQVGILGAGLAGGGKSVATQALVFSALALGWRLALINTVDKATDFAWAKQYVSDGFWGCDSLAQSVAVAKRVNEEGERLGRLLSKHQVSKWQELPRSIQQANPPLLLVADELAALLVAPKLPPGLSKEMRELPEFVKMSQTVLESGLLVSALSNIPAVYRAAGIRVMYITQQPNQNYGFNTTLKGNLPHRAMFGLNPSLPERGHAFRAPEKVPHVPKNIAQDASRGRGVGLVHLEGQEPAVFKGFYAPLDRYISEAQRRGFRVSANPAPTQSEINRLVPSIEGPDSPPEGFGHGPRMYQPWELDADGNPLNGYELANATRAEATRAAKLAEQGSPH